MFLELHSREGKSFSEPIIRDFRESYRAFLEINMRKSELFAWIVQIDNICAASCAVSILNWPPAIDERRGKAGLLHSLYTIPSHRRKGYARQIVQTAKFFSEEIGLKWIALGPSDDGRRLYERLGFVDVSQMRLNLPISRKID